MKTIFSVLAGIVVAAVALCGCSASTSSAGNIEGDIQKAEAALSQGNVDVAASVLGNIVESGDLSAMSAKELAMMSILYMQMADDADTESNVAMAADLYRHAYMASADSAAMYYAGVSPEKLQYAAMLASLVGNMDHPYDFSRDSIDAAEYDSLMNGHFPAVPDTTQQ